MSRFQNDAGNRSGLLLLDKKAGFTSFDSLAEAKKTFSTKKAGHTGTLDKFATGLLLILIGRGVKLNFLFEKLEKEYLGTVLFGEETDTLDPEGAIIARGEIPSLKEVEAVLANFRGDILQSPPEFSAIHINGRRAYELAREGKKPLMEKRPVTVHELEIIAWNPPEARIRACVSAGTYIRSLARDIALAAGTRARLETLKRTRIGPFRLADSSGSPIGLDASDKLHPLDFKLFNELSIPCYFIGEDDEKKFLNGQMLEPIISNAALKPVEIKPNGLISNEVIIAGVFAKSSSNKHLDDELLGVIENRCGKWEYRYVFNGN